jgi:protoporphyrinogen oxidase
MSSARDERWAVIGGGILGMTLAHRLSQNGQAVTLFEAARQLGGLAAAWRVGGVLWDRHYHVTLLSDSHLRALLSELGLENEMLWRETKTGFYTDGKLHSMSTILEFLRFPPLAIWQKLRLALTILYASKIRHWRKLETIAATDWLARWSGRKTVQKIWAPLLRAKLGENYAKVSAAFIWAIIARMYAARRTGLKKEMFGYVPGGYARILEHFGERLAAEHVDVRLGQEIKSIRPFPRGKICVELRDGREETFSRVVLTTPAPITADLCSLFAEAEKDKLKGIRYQGIVCASVLLKKPLAGFYVTNITEPGVPFTAVIEMSALVSPDHFGGHTLVYLPKYVASDDPFFSRPDDEIRQQFVTALRRMYPHLEERDVVSFRVSRVRYVLPLATLGYSQHLPSVRSSVPGVYIVNSAQIVNGTLNVNETIGLADTAVTQLLAARGSPE